MKKLTISEYARESGVAERTVRNWVSSGKLATSKEMINNRKVTVILVDENEKFDSASIKSAEYTGSQNYPMAANRQKTMPPPEEPLYSNDFSESQDDFLELIKKMYEDNRNLAELAGQAKLLTDSERRTQEQYFQLQNENKILLQENSAQKKEIELLKLGLQKLEEEKAKVNNKLNELEAHNQKLIEKNIFLEEDNKSILEKYNSVNQDNIWNYFNKSRKL